MRAPWTRCTRQWRRWFIGAFCNRGKFIKWGMSQGEKQEVARGKKTRKSFLSLLGDIQKDRDMSYLEYGRERGFVAINYFQKHERVGEFWNHCHFPGAHFLELPLCVSSPSVLIKVPGVRCCSRISGRHLVPPSCTNGWRTIRAPLLSVYVGPSVSLFPWM